MNWVEDGLRQSAYGVVCFVIGNLLLAPIFIPKFFSKQQNENYVSDPRLSKGYIVIGFISYFILLPILNRVPSLVSLISSGLSLIVTGLALSLWRTWKEGNRKAFRKILILSLIGLPFFTLTGQGFMSFGTTAVLALVAFIAGFYRPRWKVIIFGILFIYVGMSGYVTYMRDRTIIRAAVWGERPFSDRVKQLYLTASTFEWVDFHNQTHLASMDARLNQNVFIGAAVEQLSQTKEYTKGETIFNA